MSDPTPKPNPPAGFVPILGDVLEGGEVRLYPGAREDLAARRGRGADDAKPGPRPRKL